MTAAAFSASGGTLLTVANAAAATELTPPTAVAAAAPPPPPDWACPDEGFRLTSEKLKKAHMSLTGLQQNYVGNNVYTAS